MVKIAECRLRLPHERPEHEAPWIREFFGRSFEQELLKVNRQTDQQQYQYPRIQFKLVESCAVLLGIAEGADALVEVCSTADPDSFESTIDDVRSIRCEIRDEPIIATDEPVAYRFLTPWLGLNDKNFRSYTGSRNTAHRKEELSRILTANCLGLARSLDVPLDRHIESDGHRLTSIKTKMRNDPVVGFVGVFKINLQLPDLIGLGRSVARGFGAITAVST